MIFQVEGAVGHGSRSASPTRNVTLPSPRRAEDLRDHDQRGERRLVGRLTHARICVGLACELVADGVEVISGSGHARSV
jgi:hypothetical protein